MSTKFGVAVDIDKIGDIAETGYDYIELPLSLVAAGNEENFQKYLTAIQNAPIQAESFNCFFPGHIALMGDGVDEETVLTYVEKALSRAARLGGKLAVVGSGKSRSIPENAAPEKAREDFCRLLRRCGDVAEKNGMTIVLEPLNRTETNFINTVNEGLEICRRVDHPSVQCLVDFYHFHQSGESLKAIENSGGLIAHVHVSEGETREMPSTPAQLEQCRRWAEALRKCEYRGNVSLEGFFKPNFREDIQETHKMLTEYFSF